MLVSISVQFWDLPKILLFPKIKKVCSHFCIKCFYARYQVLLYLSGNEPILKCCKVLNYYVQECSPLQEPITSCIPSERTKISNSVMLTSYFFFFVSRSFHSQCFFCFIQSCSSFRNLQRLCCFPWLDIFSYIMYLYVKKLKTDLLQHKNVLI